MPIFPDNYVDDPVVMMTPIPGDEPDPTVEACYQEIHHTLIVHGDAKETGCRW